MVVCARGLLFPTKSLFSVTQCQSEQLSGTEESPLECTEDIIPSPAVRLGQLDAVFPMDGVVVIGLVIVPVLKAPRVSISPSIDVLTHNVVTPNPEVA